MHRLELPLRTSGIYQIVNLLTGIRYVGRAVCIRTRWYDHVRTLDMNTHHNKALQNAWRKYGRDAFNFDILELVSLEEMIAREQHYLNAIPYLYNHSLDARGGESGRIVSDETRRKISAALTGKKGHEVTEETRRKISEAGKGRRHTTETRNKMRDKALQRDYSGYTVSEDVRQKISERMKLRGAPKLSPESIRQMAEAKRGSKASEETRAKMSATHKGKCFTPEHRANIWVGRRNSKRQKEEQNQTKLSLEENP